METGDTPLKNRRQENFALEVVRLGDQTRAMLSAYPSRKKWQRSSVWVEAARLAADPTVNPRIAYLSAQAAKAAVVTRQRILDEYVKLAFTNLPDVVHYNGKATLTITDFEELTAAQRACVKEIKFRCEVVNSKRTVEHVELKFYDKQKALDALAKHDGLFAADNQRTLTGPDGGSIKVEMTTERHYERLDAEELKEYYRLTRILEEPSRPQPVDVIAQVVDN